ncbi:MAG: flagellar filament capping protein FliD [SAR324 cluster bacterium]|nr:flagellar filament capping protein FliD [SAR324 cluster bacterium]
MAVEFNSAASLGINTGAPNFSLLLEKITASELNRLKPDEGLKAKYEIGFASWKEVKGLLEDVKLTSETFLDRVTFNKKIATSSDPEIVTATADITAVPGTHPIVVDKMALYHQIGSQRYASADSIIGKGEFLIGLLDERPLVITIDDTNNTIQGLMDAINNEKIDISASIVELDKTDTPFQLILTSKRSGSEGRIIVDFNLLGGEPPLFLHRNNQPTRWYFAPRVGDLYDQAEDLTGSSSALPLISGEFVGDDDIDINFTVLNSGRIGVTENLTIAWQDTEDRSGTIKLGKYDYSPGDAIDVVDGVQISFQGGELVINDTFKIKANSENFNFFSTNTPPTINKPSTWQRQTTASGSPMIEGVYTGEDDDSYQLTVRKGGVIGVTEDLILDYISDNGEKGSINFGLGYKPGTKLTIGSGLTLSMQEGILQTGNESSFDVEPDIPSSYWWLFSDGNNPDRNSLFSKPLTWEGEKINSVGKDDNYDPRSRKSNAKKIIVGDYNLDEDKRYKFTVKGDGRIGVNTGLYLEWEDDKGKKSGTLEVGAGYKPGSALVFDGGLMLQLLDGYAFDNDYFYVDAFSPTIQPAQDAEVRVGVTETRQGGLKVVSSTNDMKNAIQGVTLHLHKAEDKLVTITIGEDREKVKEAIRSFVEAYNKALIYMKEALKYDPKTKISGPLQADNTLADIQDELRKILVDAIPGLPIDANTLPYAGININKDALIVFDEEMLDERLIADFERVANIFRNYAASNNSGIVYVNSRHSTEPSGNIGYEVDITQAAGKGFFRSEPINGPTIILPGQDQYIVELNGRQSSLITIDSGAWSVKQLANEIKKQIKKDDALKNIEYTVSVRNNRLILESGTYGEKSTANIRPVENINLAFTKGEIIAGKDVKGTINGHQADSSGRLLVGNKEFKEGGLQFIVTLTDAQITDKIEGNAIFSVGKGSIVNNYLDGQLKKSTGPVDTTIDNVGNHIQNLEDSLASQASRIERKRERLVKQFSRAESRISELKSQQMAFTNQGL